MESICFKTLKLQNFCKMLGERCERRAPFKVLKNSFEVIYRDQTTIETSLLQVICVFKRENPIL